MSSQLSSDILEQQFGPTIVKVLRQDDTMRVIQTIATDTGRVLELSLVHFERDGVAAFPEAHVVVRAGVSMGKAFRGRGIAFVRKEAFACRYAAAPMLQKLFAVEGPAVVVSVSVYVGPKKSLYATILEIYTGVVDWPRLFGELPQQAIDNLQLLTTYL